uniref:Anthranilate synthase component 2 n=2 Tax=Palmaria TaxID=2821 RepID=A0A455TMJ0_PALPL|nr:Anthranilate synthase component II [Palmaria palmata]
MILIVDNYDSFTFNLVQCIGEYNIPIKVVRNNAVTISEINALKPTAIIISPGPGWPDDSGISLEIIKYFAGTFPILGVCLGHQSIGQVHGSSIVHSTVPIHGKTSLVYHNGQGLFQNVTNPFVAARYHSLVINHLEIPSTLSITAWSNSGIIMGCCDKNFPMLQGIQFHPESLWTIEGKQIILNFLKMSCY